MTTTEIGVAYDIVGLIARILDISRFCAYTIPMEVEVVQFMMHSFSHWFWMPITDIPTSRGKCF